MISNESLIKKKLLVKNFFYNIAGNISPILLAIIFIPLIIGKIDLDRYGLLTLIWMIIGYFGLFDMGLSRVLTQQISESIGRNKNSQILTLIWTTIFILLVFGFVISSILFFSSDFVTKSILNIPDHLIIETNNCISVLCILFPISLISSALTGILISYQRFDLVNLITIPMSFYNYVATFIAILFTKNLTYIVLLLAIGRIIHLVLLINFCNYIVPSFLGRIQFKKALVLPLIKFGGWITISNLLSPIITSLDRFFISSFTSVHSLSFYSTPYEISSRTNIVPKALIKVLFPAYSQSYIMNNKFTLELFKESLIFIALLILPISIFIILFAREIIAIWINPEFSVKSYEIFQWLMIGVFINGLAQNYFALIQSVKRADLTAKAHIFELIIYILLLILLIKSFGLKGAAIAFTLRMIIDYYILSYLLKKCIKMPLSFFQYILIVPGAIIIVMLFLTMVNLFELKIAILGIIIVGFIVFLYKKRIIKKISYHF